MRRAFSLDAAGGRKARGIGFACCFKNVGFSLGFVDECWATVELYGQGEIERAVVRHAGAEVGQGSHTVMAQFAAEVLGIPVERVEIGGLRHRANAKQRQRQRQPHDVHGGERDYGSGAASQSHVGERGRPTLYRYLSLCSPSHHTL